MVIPEKLGHVLELVDRYIKGRMENGLGPGVALALTDRQRTLAVRTYGLADVAIRRPVTPDTLFEIGSISKAFVAAAFLRQRQAGRVDLHAPVAQYLDWFEVQSEFEPITVHHLLSHTGGIVNMIDTVPTSRYAVWKLRDTSTGFVPGEHFYYSNVGYRALGFVLEKLTGLTFADAIRSVVLEPLGLSASEPVITHDIRERLALGYTDTHYDDRPTMPGATPFPLPWHEFDGASGSVACTPADLATFLRMLLNRGQGDGGEFLSPESFGRMTQPIIRSNWDGFDHGYGLFFGTRSEFDDHFVVLNGGEMIGYETTMIGDVDDGVGVVMLVNSDYVPWAETRFLLTVLQALARDKELPALPAREPSDASMENAGEYVGVYRSNDGAFEIVEKEDGLVMLYAGESILLKERYPDVFLVPHRDWELAWLSFRRDGGDVTQAVHGADWYWNERYNGNGPTTFDYPAEWDPCAGHYRTYSPWMSNFRFYVRQGRPFIQWWGVFEQPLVALADGSFRVGEAEYSPERLRFDCFAEGRPLRAVLSGGEYYRVETP